MEALPIALNDGSWILLGVLGLFLVGLVYGFFTRGGSGIEHHPHGHERRAPGAKGRSESSGRDEGEPASPRGVR